MSNANEVIDRLQRVFGVRSDAAVGRELGVPSSTVGSWRQRGTIPYADCSKLAIEKGINLNWLLNGIGDPGIDLPRPASYAEWGVFGTSGVEEPKPVTDITGKPSVSKNSLATDTAVYPPNKGAIPASPDLVILKNCIAVLEERESYRRLGPDEKARAVVALYELYQLNGDMPGDLLQRSTG